MQANFDVLAQAGGPFIALDKQWPVAVTNGQIVIQFIPVAGQPNVAAIEILGQ